MSDGVVIFTVASAAIVVAMVLTLSRAFAGPTLYDRILAGNSFGTKTVLFLGVFGFLTNRPDFLDIAVLYALLNFVSTIAILKFFRYRTLTASMQELDEPEFLEPVEGAPAREPAMRPPSPQGEGGR